MSHQLLLRKLKYRASMDADTMDWMTFYDAEFKGEEDPDLSTYRALEDHVQQLTVEHHANADMDPPRFGLFVDVGDLALNPHEVPEGEWFSFTRDAHVQVGFDSFSQVQDLASALHKQLMERKKQVFSCRKEELRHYAAMARDELNAQEWSIFLAQADPEWVAYPKRKKGV